MKHKLEIKFIVEPGFTPAVNAQASARSPQSTQTVLVILPDGKVVRRVQPAGGVALLRHARVPNAPVSSRN